MIFFRQLVGAAGLLLAGAAVGIGHRTLAWAAVALLGLSVALRLFAAFRRRGPPSGMDSASEGEDE